MIDSIVIHINGCKHLSSGTKIEVFLRAFLSVFALNGHIWDLIYLDMEYLVYLGFIQSYYYYNHAPYFMAS